MDATLVQPKTMHIVLPVNQMYDVFPLWTGGVSTGVEGEKLRRGGTCDIICKLFEDELAFVLCQGTHRGKEKEAGSDAVITHAHKEVN